MKENFNTLNEYYFCSFHYEMDQKYCRVFQKLSIVENVLLNITVEFGIAKDIQLFFLQKSYSSVFYSSY
jgi:hypothetical protein